MPIFNGVQPIGKVHLNTGTSVDQIGSVYYFNGAEAVPIYSAEQQLYYYGDTFDSVTGGFTSYKNRNDSLFETAYVDADGVTCMRMYCTCSWGAGWGVLWWNSANLIDLTGYSKIIFRCKGSVSYSGNITSSVGVAIDAAATNNGNFVRSAIVNSSEFTNYEVDISDLNGEFYVRGWARCYVQSNLNTMYISEIILQ